MTAHYYYLLLTIIIVAFVSERFLAFLNHKNADKPLPKEVEGLSDEDKRTLEKAYSRANYRFSWVSAIFSNILIIALIVGGGLGKLDAYVSNYVDNEIWQGLLYFGILAIGYDILTLPFSIYGTFVIEQRFGFNKTTPKTFVLDKIKGWVLGAIIGGLLLAGIIWFYQLTHQLFWIFAWGLITLTMIFLASFYTSIILLLFNKLTPLSEGELRNQIEKYSKKVGFTLTNVFVINGSKRSSKANAFFSGLGSKKTIVLYDTLIENHTVPELVAVLAHEVGHYKKKHSLQSVLFAIVQTGVMLFILSLFIKSDALANALGSAHRSFQVSLVGFTILYSPLSTAIGIFLNMLSRKNEYQADAWAKETYNGDELVRALKKMSVDHLSNLNPHRYYVFVNYSHPTLAQRIKALKDEK